MHTRIGSHRLNDLLTFVPRLLILFVLICAALAWPAVPPAIAKGEAVNRRVIPPEPGAFASQSDTGSVAPSAPHSPAQGPPPIPLPRHCGSTTPPGMDPPACCAFGYIYYDDEPVPGVSVRVEGPHSFVTVTTTSGGDSDDPYYSVALGYPPISATVGSLVTFTASYSDMISARVWTVQSEGQQVDLGLLTGYRSAEPLRP